jgi:pSer/pThr/pTyr-binding forkhead associated (FHA) protein
VPYHQPTADQSVAELQRQIELERQGEPFLVHRSPDGIQHLVPTGGRERIAIGREPGVDVEVVGDEAVSRLHAELTRLSGVWVVADDGLSRNGTLVNGERVQGRRRLRDRDLIVVGDTGILFRDPAQSPAPEPTAAAAGEAPPPLGETQRRVLLALCRPLAGSPAYAATPASNQEIADELVMTVGAVKANLRILFEKFDVGNEPQNRKRAVLADRALRTGAVHLADLR